MGQDPGGAGPGRDDGPPALTPRDVLRGLLSELSAGSPPDGGRTSLACTQGHRRIEFLEQTIAEVRSWPDRGLLPTVDAQSLAEALAQEIREIEGLIEQLRNTGQPAVPVAKLVLTLSPSPDAPLPVLSPTPAAEGAPAPVPAAAPAQAETPAPALAAPLAPKAPWYAEEKNLRILANLGILVFNVGLIGFITSAWGSLQDTTKVAILTGYAAMLLAGGLALRLKTRLAVTGTALLALAVLAVPIDFFAVHYYGLTGLSRGAVGLLGAGACWLVAAGIGLATGEGLFFWIAYLAKVGAVCWGCDAAGLESSRWSGPLLGLFLACLVPAWIGRRRGAAGTCATFCQRRGSGRFSPEGALRGEETRSVSSTGSHLQHSVEQCARSTENNSIPAACGRDDESCAPSGENRPEPRISPEGSRTRAPGLLGKLLAPAESVAMVGAAGALLLHLGFWLGSERLDARAAPATVIVPLVLACAFFALAAALERKWAPLIPATILKPVILLASLRAADVELRDWPAWLMLLAVAMVSIAAALRERAGRGWTIPHQVAGWLSGSIALLWAMGGYAMAEIFNPPSGYASELNVLLLAAAWPLAAGAAFGFARRSTTGTILAGLVALLETALLLRRWDATFEVVPAAFVLLALVLTAIGLLARRSGQRRAVQAVALPIIADLAAALGMLCLLARVDEFWAAGPARWALVYFLAAALLYFGELAAGRRTAWPALAAAHLAVVAAVRSAGLEWAWLAPALAGSALVSALALPRFERLRPAALVWANLAGAAALALALAVCLARPADRWLALAAVAGAGLVQLLTARAMALAPARFSGLLIEGIACGLLAFQLGLPARHLWAAAAGLAILYHLIGELGRERSWKEFASAASDLAVGTATSSCLFSVLIGQAGWGILPALLLSAGGAAVFAAVGWELRKPDNDGSYPAASAFLWAAAFVALAGVEVIAAGTRLWPELFLLAAAAVQLDGAIRRRLVASEYAALAMLAAGYLLALEDLEVARRHLCLLAAAVPPAFHGLSLAARRAGWPCFARSAFDLATPAAWGVVPLALAFSMGRAPSSDLWRTAPLWNAVAAFAVLGALHLALSFARQSPREWPGAAYFNFAGSALAAAAYLLVLRIFSTGTPYRALWIMGIVPPLAAYGLLLVRAGRGPRGWAALAVGLGVSALALWQSLLFPDRPLVAALAFAVAAALYGTIAAFLRSPWFGAAASAAFTVAFFSMLRRLHVPPDHYVLWLTALGALQSLTGSLSGRGERTRRPAMFAGMLLAAGAVTWIAARHDVYLDRSGGSLDAAIWTTLAASAVFAIVAVLRRSLAAAYPAAAMLLGSYYLVLHRFEVGYAEPYAVPVALLVLVWAHLVAARRWGAAAGTTATVAGLALALAPSLVLSIDRTSDQHLGHMLSAFGLALAAVVAGMAMRRKAYLVAGAAAFALEGFIKLVHFKIRYHVTDWVWLLLVGMVIIGFVLYAETKRNARLRSRAEEARAKFRAMFEGWE